MKRIGLLIGIGTLLAAAAMPFAPATAQQANRAELRVGLDNFWEENLDPTRQSSGGAEMISLMYDNPLQIDENGKVVPGIVDKWEPAADGKSWTLHVRNDVLFHDGSKLTAKDIAFSYQRAVADGSRDANQWKSILGAQPRIEVVDDQNLRIFTDGPKPFFAIYSAGTGSPAIWVVPKDYIEKNGQQYFEEHPVGTGVYKFVKRVRGDTMTFEFSDKNWSKANPDFKLVTHYLVPEEATRINLLKTGKLDAMRVGLEGAKDLSKVSGVTVIPAGRGMAWLPVVGSYHALAKGKPLGEVKVRQALSLAINRKEIIDTLLNGLGGMPSPPRVGWNNPDMTDALRAKWQPWATDNYRYDLVKAKSLLAEAGYPNGFSFDVWIAPDSSATYLQDLGVILAHYWEAIGVKANIVQVDAAAINARRNTKSSTELVGKAMLTGSDTYRPNSIDYLSHFTSDKGSLDLLVGAPDQPEADKLWAEAQSTMDQARYEQIIDRLIAINTADWVAIPVVTAPVTFAFGPRVKPVVPARAQFLSRSYVNFRSTGVQ